MYCPKCTTPANDGQRFCRQCGTNLGVIVDAMEGRRGPVDFERLKGDLKDLGNSLRAGFEQAHQEFKKNQKGHRQRHQKQHEQDWEADVTDTATTTATDVTTTLFGTTPTAPSKPKRSRESRRYHLQKGILSIFSGSAVTGAYYLLLNTAAQSGLLVSLEQMVLQKFPHLTGLVPVVQMLWVFGLIPVATGLAHLINGAFFGLSDKELQELEAARVKAEPQPLPWTTTTVPPTPTKVTNEFAPELSPDFSVTEDPTLPLGQRAPKRQAS
ncbi:MAG TPA: zinc ribbon domain-containing protein [Blastocatellia bacterium]|nr:zinc ribbon domain-containing protein [Blastocatellia bacterium]